MTSENTNETTIISISKTLDLAGETMLTDDITIVSKAQQSCVPATAPRTHVIKQQSDGDAMKKNQ